MLNWVFLQGFFFALILSKFFFCINTQRVLREKNEEMLNQRRTTWNTRFENCGFALGYATTVSPNEVTCFFCLFCFVLLFFSKENFINIRTFLFQLQIVAHSAIVLSHRSLSQKFHLNTNISYAGMNSDVRI